MSQIQIQPRTAYTGAYGGYGEYGGFSGISSDGTRGAAGGAGYHVNANGGWSAGAGAVAAGPNGLVAGGRAAADNAYFTGAAAGRACYDAATGEFNSVTNASWTSKATGESHARTASADIQKGQGGTLTVTKDGQTSVYSIPARPAAE